MGNSGIMAVTLLWILALDVPYLRVPCSIRSILPIFIEFYNPELDSDSFNQQKYKYPRSPDSCSPIVNREAAETLRTALEKPPS